MSTENPDVVFIKEYIKTGDALLAFNRAGYPTDGVGVKVMAERTLARPEIRLALGVLAEMGIEKEEDIPVDPLSRDGLINRLDTVYHTAVASESLPSAINAVKTQAQLLGYMDTVVNVNHNVRAVDLSLDDLRAMVNAELASKPVPALGGPGEEAPAIIEGEYTDVRE